MTRAVAARRLHSASPQSSIQPPGPINPDVYYTEAETAVFLRLKTPKTLTIWRCRGEHPELRFIKRFGRVLYKGSDIIGFLDGTAVAEPAPATARRRKARP